MGACPKLRDDLVFRPQTLGRSAHIVIKDPLSRRFFRFGEVEHYIAQQLDGTTSLDEVRRRVEEHFHQPLPEATLTRFVEQFRRFRLLDDGTRGERHGHERKIGGSILYIRLKAIDPDRLLEWLTPRLDLIFTRSFVVLSALTILGAIGVVVGNWSQFTHDLTRLYRFDAFLLAWITMLTVTTGHEMAHAVTCKRFGGHVHEMGFLLIYFQPAFYCNISDAWLIPEKSKRLWITFAGAYFETLVCALATFAWRITESDTWVNFLALVIMATSGIKGIFNMNPLIKLDGYYLLSDYLEIPNLRWKSTAALKRRLSGLWNLSREALVVRGREERIYLAYGALAATYSIWLMTIIALRFGNYLVDRYRGVGFVIFATVLGVAFQRPIGRVLSHVPRTQPGEPGVIVRSWRRRPFRRAFIAALLAIVAMIPAELKIGGDFRILPVQSAEVRTEVEGILVEIYKDEGERVEIGDAIARLDDREYSAELEKVDAQIAEAQARHDMLQAGPRTEELALARSERDAARLRRDNGEKMLQDASRFRAAEMSKVQTTVEKAEQRLQFARNDLDRLQRLFASALVPRQTVEDAEHELAVRQKEVEEAQGAAKMVLSDQSADAQKERDISAQEFSRADGRLRVVLAGSRPEEIAAIDAEMARLRAQRNYLDQQLQRVRVTSPVYGVIATPKLRERRGERVSRGDLIARVFDQGAVTAEIRIPEKEIADVHVGQTVVMKARAFPDRSFTSRVTAIAPVAIEDDRGLGGKVIRVMTDIDNASGLLKPEMTGNAKIYAGTRRIFQLATRRLARYIRVEFWSWW